jgi:hypothetical protein
LNLYSASSLKQQTSDIYVAPFGHIILIPSQPVFALSSYVASFARSNNTNFTNCIDFGLTRSGLEPTIYPTRGSNPRSTTLGARTHDLPHSGLEPTIYHTRCSNPRSTTLGARTHDLPHSGLEPSIYHTRGLNPRSTTLEACTLIITPPMPFLDYSKIMFHLS